MAKILSLTARLGFDGTGFNRGMKSAKDAASNLKNTLAGAFAAVGVSAFVRNVVTAADQIADLSERFDILPEKLQEMQYWATQNAASVDDLTASFDALDKSKAAALAGDEGKIAAFGRMGVKREEIATLSREDVFSRLNKSAMQRGQGNVMPDMRELFSKSASKLSAAFQVDMGEAGKAAREFGAVMSNETVYRLAAINDEFSAVAMLMKATFAPAILSVVGAIGQAIAILGAIKKFSSGDPAMNEAVKNEPAVLRDSVIYRYALSKVAPEKIEAARKNIGAGESKSLAQMVEEAMVQYEIQAANQLASIREQIANRRKATPEGVRPSILGGGMISGGKMRSTIESDAFAKIGGFVGASGSVNHLKESADANKALLALARGQGIKTVIKE